MAPDAGGVVLIRVVVVDDQAVIRTGLRTMLEHETDITIVGEAGNGAEAVQLVARARPDVVLMDVRMPEVDGIEATRRILADATPSPPAVLVLTTFDDDEYVFGALRAGAAGFLLKDVGPDVLVAADTHRRRRRRPRRPVGHAPAGRAVGGARGVERPDARARCPQLSGPSAPESARSSSASLGAAPTASSPTTSSSARRR